MLDLYSRVRLWSTSFSFFCVVSLSEYPLSYVSLAFTSSLAYVALTSWSVTKISLTPHCSANLKFCLSLISRSLPFSSSYQALYSTIAALAFKYCLYNFISLSSFANRSSSSFLAFFLDDILLYASLRPCSRPLILASSLAFSSAAFCSRLVSASVLRFLRASSIFLASSIRVWASRSFLARFYSRLKSFSCSIMRR